MELNKIYNTDCLQGLKELQSETVNCCVTSPPYYALRDYEVEGQIGLERTPEEYILKMVKIFRQVKRVLTNDGTLWLNMGDSYWGGKGRSGSARKDTTKTTELTREAQLIGRFGHIMPKDGKHEQIKTKELLGIPFMLAFALRQPFIRCIACKIETHFSEWGTHPRGTKICPMCYKTKGYDITELGWYLRQDIIWNKPNPMPESVTDRCTKAHEYIFLLSKCKKYHFDHEAIKKPMVQDEIANGFRGGAYTDGEIGNSVAGKRKTKGNKRVKFAWSRAIDGSINDPRKGNGHVKDEETRNSQSENSIPYNGKAAKRSVWTVATYPFSDAHFATFPPNLIVDCIVAGCPEGGTVLDPFMGAGTTAMVSRKLNRNYIGFELNPEYIKIAEKRLFNELGLYA